jgi:hypothetical protein
VTLSEQRYDIRGGYGYDFGPLLMGGGTRLTLAALGMLEYQRWQNEVYPADYFGLGIQGLGRYLLAGPFAVVGGAGITWNVLGGGSQQSAIGHAKQDAQLRLGLEMAITERNALEISYRGDLLTFDNDYRFTNGLSLGFGTSF